MQSIFNYIYTKDNDNSASVSEVYRLLEHVVPINDDNSWTEEFVKNISSNFPIPENVNIRGSQNAINAFLDHEINKFDVILGVSDLTNLDFPRETDKEIFVPDRYLKFDIFGENSNSVGNSGVRSIYRSKELFLDTFYAIDRFTNFALSHDYKSLVLDDISNLNNNEKIQKQKAKFRLIEFQNQTYFRSLVNQNRYKTFDNPIVFYMSISKLSNFSRKKKIKFDLNYMYMTDSKLELEFMESVPYHISESISIQTGITVTNSELGDGAALFNFNYKIMNEDNHHIMVQSSELAKINHGYTIGKISEALDNIDNFITNRESLIDMLKNIDWTKRMGKDSVEYALVFAKIKGLQKSRSIPKQVKIDLLLSIDPEALANRVVNLFQIFGMLSESIENESRDIQRIIEDKFNSMIVEISRRNIK